MFKNNKGFTLVELVVVIAIIGILAGIAIPMYTDATATARGARIVADIGYYSRSIHRLSGQKWWSTESNRIAYQ